MKTQTENLINTPIKEANEKAYELWNHYREERKQITITQESSIEELKKLGAYFDLTMVLLTISTCGRRSQKMKLDLLSAISRAEDNNITII